jgi:hypothetical protein
VAITLGKDCSISLGGNIASARSVTLGRHRKQRSPNPGQQRKQD